MPSDLSDCSPMRARTQLWWPFSPCQPAVETAPGGPRLRNRPASVEERAGAAAVLSCLLACARAQPVVTRRLGVRKRALDLRVAGGHLRAQRLKRGDVVVQPAQQRFAVAE